MLEKDEEMIKLGATVKGLFEERLGEFRSEDSLELLSYRPRICLA